MNTTLTEEKWNLSVQIEANFVRNKIRNSQDLNKFASDIFSSYLFMAGYLPSLPQNDERWVIFNFQQINIIIKFYNRISFLVEE